MNCLCQPDLHTSDDLDVLRSRLIRTLQPLAGARVVDVGCGWGELLLRIAAAPSVSVVGIDTDRQAIEHGLANAIARGVGDRVELHIADVSRWPAEPADVAICIGASHAWGGAAAALDALGLMLRPGGRVLLGEGFWMRTPTEAAVAALDGEELGSLADRSISPWTTACGPWPSRRRRPTNGMPYRMPVLWAGPQGCKGARERQHRADA